MGCALCFSLLLKRKAQIVKRRTFQRVLFYALRSNALRFLRLHVRPAYQG